MSDIFIPIEAGRNLIDQKYDSWRENPDSVELGWRYFFQGFEFGSSREASAPSAGQKFSQILWAYRSFGHCKANLDPLGLMKPELSENLILENYGIQEKDLQEVVSDSSFLNGRELSFKDALTFLDGIYSGSMGFEFSHIEERNNRMWLIERIEDSSENVAFNEKEALQILFESQLFEEFLGKKFVGEKRFSFEGGEGAMLVLKRFVDKAAESQVKEISLGMAHRGRLNVLAHFVQKPLDLIFREFFPEYVASNFLNGDVKYHLGYENTLDLGEGRNLKISLSANPSHLEAVNSIVEGKVRGAQEASGLPQEESQKTFFPLLIHGDAAFAGQGVVFEGVNASCLDAYNTGGTIHLIINNQIGFTTNPEDARSSRYCSDVAKCAKAPIFHVNGESPEELIRAVELAFDYRQKFHSSVVIDIYCYRRHGHNETDQPEFTQPLISEAIKNRSPFGDLYASRLVQDGKVSQEEVNCMKKEIFQKLEGVFSSISSPSMDVKTPALETLEDSLFLPCATGVSSEDLQKVEKALLTLPSDFSLHPTLEKRFFERRKMMVSERKGYDWALAESLAWGTLLQEGYAVRISGQDCQRGTFTHRHAVLFDSQKQNHYVPLEALSQKPFQFAIYNSLLSESAVLGFEYGYSLSRSDALVLWEAQFGDFVNGAQIVIDQFISSAKVKWGYESDLVLLLPHGYEGMGPEHSSARLERFLQSCAQKNMQVANLTTPAQYFHILRRQKKREERLPLVLMSPKSLLSHPQAVSLREDFTCSRGFQEILPDPALLKNEKVNQVVFCTGRVFYDLLKYREEKEFFQTAIIRVEQIYPLHIEMIEWMIEEYPKANRFVWCQEEPQNMGAWSFIAQKFEAAFSFRLEYAGREASASAATGFKKSHKDSQDLFLSQAFEKSF